MSDDPSTFTCALGNLTGISPKAFSVEGELEQSKLFRDRLLASGIVVSFYIKIPVQAYGYSSAYDAYLALNQSLHRAVDSGQFTYLVNMMSESTKFSQAYLPPVYSNYIVVDPFLFSLSPTVLPSTNSNDSVSAALKIPVEFTLDNSTLL